MASVIDICNQALSPVRRGSINSLTEGSIQAQQCALHYESCRDELLEKFPWGFAKTVSALNLLSTIDPFKWTYAWQYPATCKRIWRLRRDWEDTNSPNDSGASSFLSRTGFDPDRPRLPQEIPVEYEIQRDAASGQKIIVTYESDLYIEYNALVTDPNQFTALFRRGLAHLLTSRIAIPVAGYKDGSGMEKDALNKFAAWLLEAQDASSNQEYYDAPPSEFETVRQ